MAATQSEMRNDAAERLLRQAFESDVLTAESEPVTAAVAEAPVAAPVAAPALDEREPTDEELAQLTADEEEALFGKG
ncbi:MAG TPA: hypothetical protein VFY89_08530, partial [Ktedonobacterales bacterium]